MSLHPLIQLSVDREVKQAKGFKEVAARLDGGALDQHYQQEVANAPKRASVGKPYLGAQTGRKPKGRQHGKDEKHLAAAIARHYSAGGPGADETLELPSGEKLEIVDHAVPLRTAAPDKAKGDQDPNAGVEDVSLLGVLGEDRIAVGMLKYLEPDSTRSGAGDTPLKFFLAGLAQCAMVDANREGLRAEILEKTGKTIGDEAPALLLLASARYWELCRKREAQKGAAWVREIERLSREVAEQIGVEVFVVAVETAGNPGWDYDETGPVLSGAISLDRAWEPGAGKLKPKPKPKKQDPAEAIIEADPEKPVRPYKIHESYQPGDRVEHVKLGEGVVQSIAGRGKISVRFGEENKLLIHERPQPGA